MKKIIFAASLLLLGITTVNAQKKSPFEGKVVFDMAFDGSGLPPEALAMLQGSTVTMYNKGNMRREVMATAIATTTSIVDEKNKTVINLMDMAGKKFLIRMNESDLKRESDNTLVMDIKYSDDTKILAGYKCKRADVTVRIIDQGIEETVTVFYTDELPYTDFRSPYKGLKGFPMAYSVNQGGMKIGLTASKVSKETVEDDKFTIPGGYTETTMEQLQKGIGQ